MLIRLDTLQPWAGERLDGILHPTNIEQLWTADELAAINLAILQPFDVPPDKAIVGEPRYVMQPNGSVATEYDIIDVPPPLLGELSRWQFFAAAALAGIITEQEAEDAIAGPLPAPFVSFIETLPIEQRFGARMLLKGNQVFHRDHPFVQAFLDANGMTSEQADDIWRAGAALS